MLYEDPEFGFALSLPDNATPDIAQAHIGNVRTHYAQQSAQQQQQQQMQESLGWMGRVVGDAMAPATQFAPVIGRAAAAAMTPQGFQQTAGLMANSAQFQQEQGMRQEQMGNMNRIEQERMRMRNAEILQQQKDRKQELTIRKQDYDLRKKEHDMQIKMQEDEQKYREKEDARKEKDALKPQLHESSGMQYVYDATTNTYKASVVPGAESVQADYTRAPSSGGGGTGKSSKAKVSFLPGFEKSVGPNNTPIWVNQKTGEYLDEKQYGERITIENAWEGAYNPKIGNYEMNTITGEERLPAFLQQQQQQAGPATDLARDKWINDHISKDVEVEEYPAQYQSWAKVYDQMNPQSNPMKWQGAYRSGTPDVPGTYAQGQAASAPPSAPPPPNGATKVIDGTTYVFVGDGWEPL